MSQDTSPLLNKVTRAPSDILIGQTRSVNSSHGLPKYLMIHSSFCSINVTYFLFIQDSVYTGFTIVESNAISTNKVCLIDQWWGVLDTMSEILVQKKKLLLLKKIFWWQWCLFVSIQNMWTFNFIYHLLAIFLHY